MFIALSLSHTCAVTHIPLLVCHTCPYDARLFLLKVDAGHIFAYMRSQWRVIFVFTTAALSGGLAMNSI